MGEQKSKFPSFGEVTSMAGKLFDDMKKSVCEIVGDYKAKRAESTPANDNTHKPSTKSSSQDEPPTSPTSSSQDEPPKA